MAAAFQKFTRGSRTVLAAPELSRDLLLRLTEYPELPLNRGPAEIVKAGNSALVVRTEMSFGPQMKPVLYKRVSRKNWIKRVTQSLSTNRTLRAFLIGHRLLRLGVPTAKPLAVIIPGRFQLSEPSYLAAEWLTGAEDLDSIARQCRSRSAARLIRIRATAEAVGTLLGKLHAAGAAHRDLKAQNLMVRFHEKTGTAQAFAIDLDGVTFPAHLGDRLRWRNLSRLAICEFGWSNYGPATRLRFLKAYLTAAKQPRGTWKREWRGIAAASVSRIRARAA